MPHHCSVSQRIPSWGAEVSHETTNNNSTCPTPRLWLGSHEDGVFNMVRCRCCPLIQHRVSLCSFSQLDRRQPVAVGSTACRLCVFSMWLSNDEFEKRKLYSRDTTSCTVNIVIPHHMHIWSLISDIYITSSSSSDKDTPLLTLVCSHLFQGN